MSNSTSGPVSSPRRPLLRGDQDPPRSDQAKAATGPDFKSAMEKMDTPVYYLDGPEFQKFWDKDANRFIKAMRNIGKVQ